MTKLTDLNGETKLACVIGNPVKHSMSPIMYNTAIDYLSLNYTYLAFEIQENQIEDTIKAFRTLNACAINVTMPFKQTVMPFLDEIDKSAELIGSVNTIINDDGKFIGYNTDGKGYVNLVKSHDITISGKKIVLVGVGGAGRSIAIELALENVSELVLLANNQNSAKSVYDTLEPLGYNNIKVLPLTQENLKNELIDADMLINCTSVGMNPNPDNSIIEDESILHKNLVVSDIIYHPHKTKLLTQAENIGCTTIGGVGMLFHQGAIGFKLWTGYEIPLDYVMEQIKL